MKTTLKACPNITKREINNAVMAGRKFCVNADGVKHLEIHWDDNHGNSPVRQGLERWNWRGFKNLCELVEVEWYNDPAMVGKPVRVKDNFKDEWSYDFFSSFRKDSLYTFNCINAQWAFCEPLTPADLYQES